MIRSLVFWPCYETVLSQCQDHIGISLENIICSEIVLLMKTWYIWNCSDEFAKSDEYAVKSVNFQFYNGVSLTNIWQFLSTKGFADEELHFYTGTILFKLLDLLQQKGGYNKVLLEMCAWIHMLTGVWSSKDICKMLWSPCSILLPY